MTSLSPQVGRGKRRRRLCVVLLAALAAATGVLAAAAYRIATLDVAALTRELAFSTLVLDRDGKLLRPYTTAEGRWRLPASTKDIDPRFIELLLAYEDKRFRSHFGIDPLALGRAFAQLLRHGRVVSGASTITMQVARLLEPRAERSIIAKLRQMALALALERALGKDQILDLYLSLAPYGGNLEGVRAAALAYLGKESRRLTLGEAALLVALPQSPEQRRPDRSIEAARNARDRVLERIAAAGIVSRNEIVRARHEPVAEGRRPMPMLAPHAADAAVAAAPERQIHRLTIESALQRSLEELARERVRSIGPDISAAILAVDNASGEVLARVASADYLDLRRAGHVDMTAAVRSPGSTLKPFIYGLGFEDGLVHPETLLEDRPARFGSYSPENFDLSFQGTVTARRALQLSLNVPAVAVLERVGPSRLNARLREAGAPLMLPSGEVPGLAVGLGGVGVRLIDLVTLYVGLARLGSTVALNESFAPGAQRPARRLLDSAAAWYVGNILLGSPPPENAAGGRIAFKTGTSYGNRDAWAVGFDGRRTIGVWVGRPDGAPIPELNGRASAAPILFDAFARTGKLPASLPPPPPGVLVTTSAKLPPPLQRLHSGVSTGAGSEQQLRILFPPHGARLELAGGDSGRPDPIALKVTGGVGPLTVLVNGVPLPSPPGRRTLFFEPDGPGFARLTVMDAEGASDSVVVRLQ